MNLTNDEMNLLCIYKCDTRIETMDKLVIMQKYLQEDEAELRKMSDSLLDKLEEITDEEFSEVDVFPDFDI